ncbi:hypothetical protein EVJ58_g3090 [Rhodofomes roseus]|uniref:Lysine methyltransferase n=1 Tax=Rhodofomes roseus TaxID=34475 RepID=A0A4Y9YPQ6_9APHY|nr:hypothetical protein EVJ58_g3090 [Rhodofomes roseus]
MGFRGLGHVDSQQDTLAIDFVIDEQSERAATEPAVYQTRSRRSIKKKSKVPTASREHVISIELLQDKTALRSRKGDTGSVVWRASVDFAQYVLRSYHTRAPDALLDADSLCAAHVLELGAGTGLLGIALSPIVARYTLTDIDALIPLIQKNLAHNRSLPSLSRNTVGKRRSAHGAGGSAPKDEEHASISIEALDWEALRHASPALRRSSFQYPAIDVLLVVDCIYHPSLLPALLSTIDYLTTPGVTSVLVVVELRAEDVVREFLAGWLRLESDGIWQVWSVPEVLDGPYAVWVGWKTPRRNDNR